MKYGIVRVRTRTGSPQFQVVSPVPAVAVVFVPVIVSFVCDPVLFDPAVAVLVVVVVFLDVVVIVPGVAFVSEPRLTMRYHWDFFYFTNTGRIIV